MTQTSVGSSCMAQQLYFCVFHVMWCIQTERAEEPPAGCLKTLASPHKARPTELQHTLNLMAANVHIGIHLEPAAPDVNKQYNFTALPPPPPPLFTTTYSWPLFSAHCHSGSKPSRRFPPSALSVTACFVLSSEVSIVRGSFNKRGLAWKGQKKGASGGEPPSDGD